jgi:hypothetical protein
MKSERIKQLEQDLTHARQQRDDAWEIVRRLDVVTGAQAQAVSASSVYPVDVRHAVLAVAIRLEERADKHTVPNGAALAVVESLYERAASLREVLGETVDTLDEENAEGLLEELIGSGR